MIGPWQLVILGLILLLPLFALIDIVRNEFTNTNKLIWILIVLFFPFLGPILYFIFGLKQKTRK
ncbi:MULTISPECIES: PLD nuclease N-terminal domain-containing protein [Marinifilum]|uniref:PLD nuclease N-terminal domain-containing protein n=1 Tax=Marinifilum TaxID=866673 RepID=UPI0038B3047E